MRQRLRERWLISTIEDPLQRRQASLLQAMLLVLLVFAAFGLVTVESRPEQSAAVFIPIAVNISVVLVSGSALALMRRGHFRLAVAIVTVGLLFSFGFGLVAAGIRRGSTLPIAFALPITLAGLLLDRRALWLTSAACVSIMVGVAVLEDRGSPLVGFAPSAPLFVSASAFFFSVVLLSLFIDQFSITAREALRDAQSSAAQLQAELDERRRLEAQLIQSQRMEGIGRLAGGIAHDFNNLLTAIIGYVEFVQAEVPDDLPLHDDLTEIMKAALRASDLTRQLLAFARRQVIELRHLNLNDLIVNIDKLLRRLIGEHIELVTLPAPYLGVVKADLGQIEQVLINLAVNARDAMPAGGKLTIETANVTLDTVYSRKHLNVTPGDYVMLAVSDTGVGMDAAARDNAFEPFFTTKGPGQGTGLGLATCYGIVNQHGGHIWIYSEPGQGATFKVYLPRVADLAENSAATAEPRTVRTGTETLLVVEDEPAVREVVARTLREHHYRVFEAGSPEEAMSLVQRHAAEAIAMLITDVVMPQMSGKALAEWLGVHYPDIKVMFISGYTDNAIVHHGHLDPDVNFLQKPFSSEELTRKIRQILDR